MVCTSCRDYAAKIRREERANLNLIKHKTKPCPHCRCPIEKNKG